MLSIKEPAIRLTTSTATGKGIYDHEKRNVVNNIQTHFITLSRRSVSKITGQRTPFFLLSDNFINYIQGYMPCITVPGLSFHSSFDAICCLGADIPPSWHPVVGIRRL